MISCDKCKQAAVTFIRYSGAHLCSKHLMDFVERRVKKEISKQCRLPKSARLAVALSGGKDSTLALYMIKKIFDKHPGIEIIALTIDEGIAGYRPESIKAAKKTCNELGVEHHITSFEERLGFTLNSIEQHTGELTPCTYCGVFRRFCLNTLAKELDVTRLVMGHNLDDMAQSIVMNIFKGDPQKMARLGPHRKIQPGLVPRLMPLRIIPEKESYLYAMLTGMSIYDGECPYAVFAQRGQFRDMLARAEEATPGTRHAILSYYDQTIDAIVEKFAPADLGECEQCGEPTNQRICKTCILKNQILASI
ncbi:TIGR00269 family protein [[Eubacterium] cellulosolvens]